MNYGLTFKKKKPSYLSNNGNNNLEAHDFENSLNSSTLQQYDDLTDVRVMAKMQEDSK